VVSIGGDEVAHFLEWVDFAGNGASSPLAPLTDPRNRRKVVQLLTEMNLILGQSTEFFDTLNNLAAAADAAGRRC
jgi:hypothetical protein